MFRVSNLVRVQSLGFRGKGSGCRVQGFGFRFWDLGSGFRVECSGLTVYELGIRD